MSSPEPLYSQPPPQSVRDEVIQRDRSTCYLCGTKLDPSEVVLDHIIPKSRGGSNTASNRAVACVGYDKRKADSLLSELEWVSSEVKAKYAALERECARRSTRLLIFLKRVQLAVIVFTITPARRLDGLIEAATKQE